MKITAVLKRNERSIQIEFPCGDGYLTKQLERISVLDPLDDSYIEGIYSDVSALLVLAGKYVDLDQLNYLTKRLDSFDKYEMGPADNYLDLSNKTTYFVRHVFLDLPSPRQQHQPPP